MHDLQELALIRDGALSFLGGGRKAGSGQTRNLLGARVVTTALVNGHPQTAVEVVEGARRCVVVQLSESLLQ